MSERIRRNLFRLFLYCEILLVILYFFKDITDSNKKITYIEKERLKLETIKKATILDGEKKTLIETNGGQLYILEKNGVSYGYENKSLDSAIRYVLSAVLFVSVMALALT